LVENNLGREIRRSIANINFNIGDKWLDVGCGTRPYESSFPNDTYFGVDVEESGRDAYMKIPNMHYDGRVLPFPDGSYDGVLCTQVLEHVADTVVFLAEIQRVLKPGGTLLISLPFAWQEHEEPFDFYRFTRFGITHILKNSGFSINGIVRDTTSVETLITLVNVYVINNLVPPVRGLWFLFAFGFCFPLHLFALLGAKILPDRGKMYLNLIVNASKL
jgi:SAM-dependent methyltransferase